MEESQEQLCRDIMRTTLAKRDWQLIEDGEQFAARIGAGLAADQIHDAAQARRVIECAVVREYCAILHAAAGTRGSRAQRRAFQELWDYLYRIACYKIHDPVVAQDLTQQALSKIWNKYAQCRDPHDFLGWGTMILLNEIREFYRAQKRHPTSADPEISASDLAHDSDPDTETDQTIDVSKNSPFENPTLDDVMHDQAERELRVILAQCLKSRQQQIIIRESFFNAKGYKEIAEQLGISIANVHVQRHRALAKLRACEAFIRFVEDYNA